MSEKTSKEKELNKIKKNRLRSVKWQKDNREKVNSYRKNYYHNNPLIRERKKEMMRLYTYRKRQERYNNIVKLSQNGDSIPTKDVRFLKKYENVY